jgi:hypothetical protein
MDDGLIFLKTSEPHSLTTTFQMNQILARSISLDSTFKSMLHPRIGGILNNEKYSISIRRRFGLLVSHGT